ncbi:GGDEF domain-containing protein [Sphingomonas koreensis]|nr:GGDEF domain-containing protein [Sphingomonas koreensis]
MARYEQCDLKHRGDRLLRLFDWFTALTAEEAVLFRPEIMAIVMLRPLSLLLSSGGILMMSGAAMVLADRPWATAWFVTDLALLAVRLTVALRFQLGGRPMPDRISRMTVLLAFIVFMVFGAGCTATFLLATRPLPMIATASMMGLIAGLATRWAALPRLAIPAIAMVAVPFCAAVAIAANGDFAIGAIQFALVAAGTAALTLQNHRSIVAMLRAERRARVLAMTDVLTGLPNRAGLIDALDRFSATAEPGADAGMALLFVDLDGFKVVNDRHGHAAGDRVLIEVGARMAALAGGHFACRLGGDEFVVLIQGRDVAVAGAMARRIAAELARPFAGVAEEDITLGASVGIALGSAVGADPHQVLADADAALYNAKRAGGGREMLVESAGRSAAA